MRFVVPEQVVAHMHLREGDIVADFGAGNGFFMQPLSEAVGSEGTVYMIEIQRQLVEALGEHARQSGCTNISPLWGDLEATGGTKLRDDSIDCGLLVNTLFQVEDTATAAAELQRVIRPGGKLFVIDWTESYNGLGPAPDQIVTATAATDLFETAGFTFERALEPGAHHYGCAFRL